MVYAIPTYELRSTPAFGRRRRLPPAAAAMLVNIWGWSGGAMVLGKLPVPRRPTIWIIVGQGPTALAVGADGVVWTFLLSSILSLLFLPLFGRRTDIDLNTVSKIR